MLAAVNHRVRGWLCALGVITLMLTLGHAPALAVTASLVVSPEEEEEVQPPPDVRLSNEYIAIIVNATESNTGRFAVETTGGDPDRTSDDDSPLIYKVPGQSPWTSYTTLRIDGIDYVFGGEPTERAGRAGLFGERIRGPEVVDDNRIETVYRIGPLDVTQTLSIIRSTTTGLLDTTRIAYELHHVGDRPVQVGLRLMLDTMLDQNDGAPFRVEELAITTDTLFEGEQIPEFWQAFDSLSDPKVTSQGSLRGRDVTVPDRVYFSNWGAMADGLWDFNFEPNRDFTRLGEFELDSATAMYWEPQTLRPGERREFVVHYGLGGISISPGDLSLGVTSPASVAADPDEEVTFPVVAYVQNTGEGDAREVVASITLPSGLKPAAGESLSRTIGALPPGRTAQVTWRIALDRAVGGDLTYTVRVEAINAEANQVQRSVRIVAPAQLTLTLDEPNAKLGIDAGRWTPLPYKVTARVTNSGGADADNVTVTWDAPIGLELAPGDEATKPIGPLEAGESATLSWHIRPQSVSASQPYPFFGNLAYSLKGNISGQGLEYRADGLLDVPALDAAIAVDTPKGGAISVGDLVNVRIDVRNLRSFYGAEVIVEYDFRAIQLVDVSDLGVERGELFVERLPAEDGSFSRRLLRWSEPVLTITPDGQRARLHLAGDRQGAMEPILFGVDGTLATLRFRVLQPGEHAVHIEPSTLRLYTIDDEGKEQVVRLGGIQNGTITVRGQ